jgi:hypothetical protein
VTSVEAVPFPEISLAHADWIVDSADVRVAFEHFGVDDAHSESRYLSSPETIEPEPWMGQWSVCR